MSPTPAELAQLAQDVKTESAALGTKPGETTSTTDGSVPTADIPPEILAAAAALLKESQTGGTKAEDPDITRGRQAYVDVWGIDPPKGYIEQLVKMGMNPYEIRAHELSKTDAQGRVLAKSTNFYRDDWANKAALVAQAMGRR